MVVLIQHKYNDYAKCIFGKDTLVKNYLYP